MEQQIAVNQELLFDPKNLTKETIKKFLCADATDQELTLGLQIAKTFNLNPLKREVYFVKYGTSPMQVLTGYEVYLKRAERSGKYAGLETTTEGNIKDGTLKAIVKIYRKDWERPLIHEAYYDEYVQMKALYKDKVRVGEEPNTFWKNKPKTMIKKVAESQGFRKAFPDEFDGMPYTSDEVVDQDKIVDVNIESNPISTKFVSKPEEPVTSPAITLKDSVLRYAKEKFPNSDEFKAWRIDQGLVEDLDKASQFELAKLLNYVKAYEKVA